MLRHLPVSTFRMSERKISFVPDVGSPSSILGKRIRRRGPFISLSRDHEGHTLTQHFAARSNHFQHGNLLDAVWLAFDAPPRTPIQAGLRLKYANLPTLRSKPYWTVVVVWIAAAGMARYDNRPAPHR